MSQVDAFDNKRKFATVFIPFADCRRDDDKHLPCYILTAKREPERLQQKRKNNFYKMFSISQMLKVEESYALISN